MRDDGDLKRYCKISFKGTLLTSKRTEVKKREIWSWKFESNGRSEVSGFPVVITGTRIYNTSRGFRVKESGNQTQTVLVTEKEFRKRLTQQTLWCGRTKRTKE